MQPIKAIDASLQVGGPATAANAWVVEFLAFCKAQSLAVDFVTTLHYPTDSFGKPGDDTETQLSLSTRSTLRDQAREVRRQAEAVPLYYTEWCTSSNPRDALHDAPYAAAFIVKTVLEANGLVDGYSYWTFSDIFEENYSFRALSWRFWTAESARHSQASVPSIPTTARARKRTDRYAPKSSDGRLMACGG